MSEKLKNLLNSFKRKIVAPIKNKFFNKKAKNDVVENVIENQDQDNEDHVSLDTSLPEIPSSPKTPGFFKKLPFASNQKLKKFLGQLKQYLIPFARKQQLVVSKLVANMHLKQKVNQTVGKIHWGQLYSSIMAPEYRIRINQIFCLLLVAAFTYSLGKIIAAALDIPSISKKETSRTFIGEATSRGTSYDNKLDILKSSNPFDAILNNEKVASAQRPGDKKDENKVCRTASRPSSLPIKLVNTVVLQDSIKSVASVQIRNTEGISLREGDNIKGLARIGKIEAEKIMVKNLSSNECEFIASSNHSGPTKPFTIFSPEEGKRMLDQSSASGIINQGNNFKIKKSYRDQQLVNLSQLLTQARALPINNPDGTISYKFTEIVPDSLYTKLGMQNGDIVHKINGSPIRSMNQVMSFFGQIKEMNHYELEITRNGSPTNLSFDFIDE
ncbi:MAG: hypothetical protein A2181_05660 [Bdellovibrionales bacterium RIFOXYA1_FULL_38_20]|nr:MAG: hypothetical protein A2181_05660 [Bdellovibrionales bacterium RIFOXYA1_FULL_38_20]